MALLETLTEMRSGAVLVELSNGLEEVVKAVRNTGKKGSLTLTLTIEPADKSMPVDAVELRDVIKLNAPVRDKKKSYFFVNDRNQLLRNDPRQMQMLDDATPVVDLKAST